MRSTMTAAVRGAAVLAALAGAGRAGAGALNPNAFTSLGAFPSAPGTYTLDTSGLATGAGGLPILSGPGGTIAGVVSNGVAVFDFDAIDVVAGQVINGAVELRATLPVAFLSRSDITVNGRINVSGGANGFEFLHGPGGFAGGMQPGSGSGPGGGSAGMTASVDVPQPSFGPGVTTHYALSGGGGGGGFGGPGNTGMPASEAGVVAGGGSGGRAYANLLAQLQGGSGGATGANVPGGGGGGAIELGAVGKISITGSILANGASASPRSGPNVGGGTGGAGGGILLHGDGVTLSGLLSAVGGNGAPGGSDGRGFPLFVFKFGAGGDGGGGQVVIDPEAGRFTNIGGTIDVGNGSFSVVPEPAGRVLLGTGAVALLACAARRRARPRA